MSKKKDKKENWRKNKRQEDNVNKYIDKLKSTGFIEEQIKEGDKKKKEKKDEKNN